MSSAFSYKPRFVDIRVRPPSPEEDARAEDVYALKPGERPCEHPECRLAATARAPKARNLPNEHYWFCQTHAAEYNRHWNFFSGMSEGEIRAHQVNEQTTGGRPTWSFKGGRVHPESANAPGKGFFDPFGMFGFGKAKQQDEQAAQARHLGKMERNALADLDLDATADAAKIRERYTEMVKRTHPDTNGGDRSTEVKFQRVVKAYKTLQKARLV